MSKKLIFLIAAIPTVFALIVVIGVTSYYLNAKATVEAMVEEPLVYDSAVMLESGGIGLVFATEGTFLQLRYCYKIPSGLVYFMLPGSDHMLIYSGKEGTAVEAEQAAEAEEIAAAADTVAPATATTPSPEQTRAAAPNAKESTAASKP